MGPMGALHSLWGERIRLARRAAELTQVQLAAAMGVAQQVVSAWEKGLYGPRDHKRTLLARILGTTVEELFPYLDPNSDEETAA